MYSIITHLSCCVVPAVKALLGAVGAVLSLPPSFDMARPSGRPDAPITEVTVTSGVPSPLGDLLLPSLTPLLAALLTRLVLRAVVTLGVPVGPVLVLLPSFDMPRATCTHLFRKS